MRSPHLGILLVALSTLGLACEGKSNPFRPDAGNPTTSQSGLTVADVVSMEMVWAASADAGSTAYDVTALPDGSATCRAFDGGWSPVGQTRNPDAEVESLLAEPGTLDALATTCPLRIADVGATITTTFVDGARVDHLVWDSCASATLDSLVGALRRIGSACVAANDLLRDR